MPGKDRMLAAMLPKGKEIWFFKVTGPEEAIESLRGTFRDFVEDIEFQDGSPKLKELPDGWRRGGEKPFRYATLDVDTPDKQLGISVSSLPLRDDAWDQQVQDNVNRWRGQWGLTKSDQKWAGGEPIVVENADPNAVWVDLVGETGGASTMSPPFANRSPPLADSSVRPGTAPPGSSVTDQRMLAAMVPKGSDIWFFKVMGEKTAVAFVEKTLQEFVENIEFNQGVPDLETLPKTWTKGGERLLPLCDSRCCHPNGETGYQYFQAGPTTRQVMGSAGRYECQPLAWPDGPTRFKREMGGWSVIDREGG